jgi:hypothetical protein
MPQSCDAQNKNCGTISDLCGHTIDCGQCQGTQSCGGGGTPNVCGGCTPTTSCAAQHKTCGSVDTGCGTEDCGSCPLPQTCGGGNNPNACGCTPATSCPADAECGTIDDGCGGTIVCGGGCDDHVDCTTDTCNSSHKCVHTADASKCDDNNMCTMDTCDMVMGCVSTCIDGCDPDAGCP